MVYIATLSMRSLLAYLFALTALLPPSGFLCIDAAGDVQVEFGITDRGESQPSLPLAIAGSPDGACDDCRDVTIPASSVSAKRLLLGSPLAATGALPVSATALSVAGLIRTAFLEELPVSHARHLSSTVIRC
jgi:hypothetical protein